MIGDRGLTGDFRHIYGGDWRHEARCVGSGATWAFFYYHPDNHQDNDKVHPVAAALCAECPVKRACLEEAIRNFDHQGVRAGLSCRLLRRLCRRRSRGEWEKWVA